MYRTCDSLRELVGFHCSRQCTVTNVAIADKVIEAPLVNPADKYAEKAEAMHKYGAYILSCLPKYVQQYSVWKDELTIYIPPSGVIPVFTFLKSVSSRCALLLLLQAASMLAGI